ncbi:MAG: hypothetical protein EA398_07730 [Deltaproteobacteria bacterium]|nr:MAG: hypothetical protein EA398_07730 [Deltaproteobacteria bacterium]
MRRIPGTRVLGGGVAALMLVVWSTGCGDDDAAPGDDPDGGNPSTAAAVGEPTTDQPASSSEPPGESPAPPDDRPRVMPMSCWLPPDSSCDVRSPQEHCGPDETCDIMLTEQETLRIQCFPAEEAAGHDAACDNRTGPFCGAGLHCVDGACHAFCCHDDECGPDEHCGPLLPELGALGVCRAGTPASTPDCGGWGAFCTTNADCCSGFCHVDHCH